MKTEYVAVYSDDYLAHHGVKGQKWGVRRYQNEDGTLTAKGQARLDKYTSKETKYLDKSRKKLDKMYNKQEDAYSKKMMKALNNGQIHKYESASAAYQATRNARKLSNDDIDAQIETLKGMTFKEMNDEKKGTGKVILKNTLMALGQVGLHAVGLPSVGLYDTRNKRQIHMRNRHRSESYNKNMEKRGYTVDRLKMLERGEEIRNKRYDGN